MDNLPAHKVSGIREAIESVGAELMYLPPYSPGLNPIELLFSKLKTKLRSAAARTIEAVEAKLAALLDCFQPNECANYFHHCGYELRI
jgi:transposase